MSLRPPLLLIVVTLLAMAGCGGRETAKETPPAPAERPATAAQASTPPPSPAPTERQGWIGVVVTRESVDVTAESQGRLRAVHVSIGDRVRRGDAIATLDTSLAQ